MRATPAVVQVWLAALARSGDEVDDSDASLLSAWLSTGDERACQLIVTRHRRRVIHVAAGVLGLRMAGEAEDVAQEAFVRAFERLATLRDPAQFGAWVARIAFNLGIERRRLARARWPHIEIDQSCPVTDREPDWLVRRAVEELPVVPRAVLHLHYWLGHTVEEIAALLSIPPNTVKSHLARGRQRVAARLEERR
jgi:RNA polymerase sigma factor (sigma-70 family)